MRKRARPLVVALMMLWASVSSAIDSDFKEALVISIQDGAHLTVTNTRGAQRTARLAGVCAPEIGQPFGRKSKFSLSDLALLKSVQMTWRAHQVAGDGSVTVTASGQDLANLQLQRGMVALDASTVSQLEPAVQAAYTAAQAMARKQRLGLWGLGATAPCTQP